MESENTKYLLGYKLVKYDNSDVLLYKNGSVIGYGKLVENANKYLIFSDGGILYPGTKEFDSFEEIVRYFDIEIKNQSFEREKLKNLISEEDWHGSFASNIIRPEG